MSDPRKLIARTRNWLASQPDTPMMPLGEYYVDELATALSDALERAERAELAIVDALGYGGEFPVRDIGEGTYYWRKWLRERAGLTPERIAHLAALRATEEAGK